MKLEGKKKWTAAIVAIAGTVVAQFAPEQQDAVMQAVQSFTPLLVGGLYIIAQWTHDEKKEQVKVEQEKTKQIQATEVVQQTEQAEIIQSIAEEAYFEPFDQEAFSKKLELRAAKTYLEVTPITVFFAAQDKGKQTKCQHIDQALAYWDFLLTKVREAFDHMYGFPYQDAEEHLAEDNPNCPYYSVENMARQKGIHFWNMLRNVRWVMRKQNDLERLGETDIDWQSKMATHDQTVFGLGTLANELLRTAQ